MTMLPAEIIRQKRDGKILTSDEIGEFISGYVAGDIPDYQTSALLMAVFFRGMTPQETADLTKSMMNSGEVYDFASDRPLVDKHSTGGVGDKVSLVLAPLAAACGLGVPMVAGRGLGHTGGTIDKLESIPGFKTQLSAKEFQDQVREIGVALVGQSDNFVPADKKLYALRDVTGTVECIPLLCSSILSKKAASGANALVMDVKCGSGAFMSELAGARELAKALVSIGSVLELPVTALITDMNQPLGRTIGNGNEVQESIECLQGAGPADLRHLTIELVAEMLLLGKIETDLDSARDKANAKLSDGSALEIFRLLIERQGGDLSFIDDPGKLVSKVQMETVPADQDGYVNIHDCRTIGIAALSLGAGRKKTTDNVDSSTGLKICVRNGDKVQTGQPLFEIYHRNGNGLSEAKQYLSDAIRLGEVRPPMNPLVIERVS